MALLVDSDDIILVGSKSRTCADFNTYLNECFEIKDIEPFKYSFGY